MVKSFDKRKQSMPRIITMIDVQGISKRYKDVPALSDIDLSVERGEIVGIAGLNGAGKSTLISIMSGILKPDRGAVLHEGVDIFKPGGARSPLTIGYVPQEIALFDSLNVSDNLNFWASAGDASHGAKSGSTRAERIGNALRMCDLADHSKKKISQLSGGMKRRANIAAALVTEPDILIMDEPTAGLDVKNRKDILLFIRALVSDSAEGSRPLTVVFTSHQAGEFDLICDRIVLLDRGKKVFDGHVSQISTYFSGDVGDFVKNIGSDVGSSTIDDILYTLGSEKQDQKEGE